jgi:hypothetical protein
MSVCLFCVGRCLATGCYSVQGVPRHLRVNPSKHNKKVKLSLCSVAKHYDKRMGNAVA